VIDVIELDRAGAADAARLVAHQQRVARSANAVVPADLIEQHVAESHLATLLERGFHGKLALRDGALVGVLLGKSTGTTAELPAAGFAIDPASSDPSQVLAELYGELAPDLLERGAVRHYLSHLHMPMLQQAVTDLGFGRISYCAIRSVGTTTGTSDADRAVSVREGEAADLETVARLCLVEVDYRYVPPVYSPPPERPRTLDEQIERHRTVEANGGAHFIASVDGADVGVLTLEATGIERGLCPDDQPFIGETATVQNARGLGVGSALVEAATQWAAHQGNDGVTVSFQPSNRLSRRFWLGAGFEPTGFWTVRAIPDSYARST
jgi:GNAT superfamily N-acetyltransferase